MNFVIICFVFLGVTPTLTIQQDVSVSKDQKKIIFSILVESEQIKEMSEMLEQFRPYYTDEFGLQDYQIKLVEIDRERIYSSDMITCELGTDGVSLIIDAAIGGINDLSNFAYKRRIPYVRLSMSHYHIAEAALTYIIKKYGRDLAIIFQNELDADLGLYNLVAFSTLRVIVLDQFSNRSLARMLSLKPQPSFYVLVASTENMNRLFKMSYDGGLVKRPDRWILIFLDFNTDKFIYKWDEFPEITKIKFEKDMCCKWLEQSAGCKCPEDFDFKTNYLRKVFHLFIEKIAENSYPLYYYNCTTPPFNATDHLSGNITKAVEKSELFRFDTYEGRDLITYAVNMSIYLNQDDQPENVLNIGRIENQDVVLFNNYTIKMVKMFLRIGTVEAIPWSYYKRDAETGELLLDANGNRIWEGYCIDLIERLSEFMEFNYEIVHPKTGKFGEKNENGVWNGLIGDLITGEADVVVAPLKMTAEREEVIDFIAPYFEQTGISIIMRKPVRETSLFKFMTVLRLEVWLSIVAALVATAIMVWILDRFSPYSGRNNKDAYPYPCREFTLKESFWFALTSFTPQGGGEAPKAISGRTLVAAYWLFVVLMLATFTANLAAFLTVERMQTPVQSLEQLSRQSRINYTVVLNSDSHQYFKNMKKAEETLYEMWKSVTLNSSNDDPQYRVWDYPIKEHYGHILLAINAAGPVINSSVGFKTVNDREQADYAFIHDSAEIKYEISRNCNYTEVGEVFAEQPYALAVQQGSNLQDELSRAILSLQKERFFEALSAKYWNHSIKGECISIDDSEGITLESLGGVFIATLVGLIVAMITLIGEIMYYRKKDRVTQITAVAPYDPKMSQQLKYNKDDQLKNSLKGKIPDEITFGNKFIPANEKLSIVALYPSDPFYQRNKNFLID